MVILTSVLVNAEVIIAPIDILNNEDIFVQFPCCILKLILRKLTQMALQQFGPNTNANRKPDSNQMQIRTDLLRLIALLLK